MGSARTLGHRLFVDGVRRPLYAAPDGRQSIVGYDGEAVPEPPNQWHIGYLLRASVPRILPASPGGWQPRRRPRDPALPGGFMPWPVFLPMLSKPGLCSALT